MEMLSFDRFSAVCFMGSLPCTSQWRRIAQYFGNVTLNSIKINRRIIFYTVTKTTKIEKSSKSVTPFSTLCMSSR
jgi:hypothetical protein